MRWNFHVFPLIVSLLLTSGCDFLNSKEEPATPTVKKRDEPPERRQPTKQAPVVEKAAKPAKAIQFSFDPAAAAPDCFASLVTLPNGPTVLQVTSYPDASAETFPSFLLWAKLAGASPEEIVGQSVPAEMFAQLASDGPVFESAAPDSVTIELTGSEGSVLSGNVRGTLREGTAAPIEITGSFQAQLLNASATPQ